MAKYDCLKNQLACCVKGIVCAKKSTQSFYKWKAIVKEWVKEACIRNPSWLTQNKTEKGKSETGTCFGGVAQSSKLIKWEKSSNLWTTW